MAAAAAAFRAARAGESERATGRAARPAALPARRGLPGGGPERLRGRGARPGFRAPPLRRCPRGPQKGAPLPGPGLRSGAAGAVARERERASGHRRERHAPSRGEPECGRCRLTCKGFWSPGWCARACPMPGEQSSVPQGLEELADSPSLPGPPGRRGPAAARRRPKCTSRVAVLGVGKSAWILNSTTATTTNCSTLGNSYGPNIIFLFSVV